MGFVDYTDGHRLAQDIQTVRDMVRNKGAVLQTSEERTLVTKKAKESVGNTISALRRCNYCNKQAKTTRADVQDNQNQSNKRYAFICAACGGGDLQVQCKDCDDKASLVLRKNEGRNEIQVQAHGECPAYVIDIIPADAQLMASEEE